MAQFCGLVDFGAIQIKRGTLGGVVEPFNCVKLKILKLLEVKSRL